ncbi:MAG: hypothetical protein OXC91_00080 [Rhodobacteraceae bacterium]|nr:hypothetical protein [Paracoccaceae bacterium]
MLFEPQHRPRVFAQPPGSDLARDLVDGLVDRCRDLAPEILARTEIYVSISSLRYGLRNQFIERGNCLLPKFIF